MKRQLPDTGLGESMNRANIYALLFITAIFLLFCFAAVIAQA
jgi:hypothetical protein